MDILETQNYLVSANPGASDRLIISVSSLGYVRHKRYQQFWGTIARTGASALFVADRLGHWFNHPDTEQVFARIAKIAARYRHVGIIGDSMGGSGALLLSNYVPQASRVLAFAPQFSVIFPFIGFDERYSKYSKEIQNFYFDNYGSCPVKQECHLLYGNTNWQDAVHRGMFEAAGFSTITVDGAPHPVAIFLNQQATPALQPLVDRFSDFTVPFTRDVAVEALGTHALQSKNIRSIFLGGRNIDYFAASPAQPEPSTRNLALNRPADQSSVGKYSVGSTTKEDACRANLSEPFSPYAFHTNYEFRPWWSVDLGGMHKVDEVVIYNRIDNPSVRSRASQFAIEAWVPGEGWQQVFAKLSRDPFGGIDGRPFRWRPETPLLTSQIRIRLFGWNSLHLCHVRIHGSSEGE